MRPRRRLSLRCTFPVLIPGLLAGSGVLAAEKRPTCTLVVSRTESTTAASLKRAEKTVIQRIYPFCSPRGQRKLGPILDESPRTSAGVRQARSEMQAAGTHFLNVRFDQAEEKARQAIKLLQIHHASLGSYAEICEAHVFLAMVLREKSLLKEAAREFASALAIDPDFSPDPALLPPDALNQYRNVRRQLMSSPRGSISIVTEPRGARFDCDGNRVGKTPAALKDLLPGTHYLRIRREGYLSWAGPVQVESNRVSAHEVSLKPTPRLVLASSGPEQTQSILADVAGATGADLILLVKIDPSVDPDEWKLSAYLSRTSSLQPQTTLAGFGQPRPRPASVAVKPRPEPQPKPVEPPPYLPPPAGRKEVRTGERGGSVFTSWWFWTLVGAAAASAAIAVPLALDRGGDLHVTLIREVP